MLALTAAYWGCYPFCSAMDLRIVLVYKVYHSVKVGRAFFSSCARVCTYSSQWRKSWFCSHSCFPALLHNCEQQSVVTCFNKQATPRVFPTVLNYTSNNDRHWVYFLFSINRLFLHTLSHVLFLCDHVLFRGCERLAFPVICGYLNRGYLILFITFPLPTHGLLECGK